MLRDVIFSLISGYLLGCIPAALIVGKLSGVDLSDVGSRNLGATNTIRVLGKKAGIVVLILDTLKGLIACLIWINFDHYLMAIAGLSSVIGHVFSIPTYLLIGRIRGGRGVATALGASLTLLPPPITVFSICVFLILFSLHKILPIDIIASFFLTTILTCFLLFTGHGASSQAFFSIAISIILLFTHQHYIANYFHGKLEYSMNKDSESVNINKIKKSIKDIKVNDGASFDEFLDNVRSIIKKDIIFSKCEMPTGTTGSILVGEKFHILYDANVSPLHQIQIKLHELGHLILGHAVNQESKKDNELIDSVLKTQQIYDDLLQGHIRRNKYNDIEEKEAELFATEILSKLRLDLDFNNDPLVKIGLG